MNYDERIAVIRAWIKEEILTRFTPPTGVSPGVAIEDVIKSINMKIRSKINPEDMDILLSKITEDILSKSKTRSLPAPAIFQQSATAVAERLYEGRTRQVEEVHTPTYLSVAAKRIRLGEPVTEFYETGSGAEELIDLSLITREDLSKYQH